MVDLAPANHEEFAPQNDLFGHRYHDYSGLTRQRFIYPPFSVLNGRDGEWQARKQRWLKIGIRSEIGRGSNLLSFSQTLLEPDKEKRAAKLNGFGTPGMAYNGGPMPYAPGDLTNPFDGTSIFDPVLCELIYRWFSPPEGVIVDPFCGGSVRGIVASILGRQYWGCDLSKEQVMANKSQAQDILDGNFPKWFYGDALDCLPDAPEADLIFSCPPYGDLEKYSDDPRDLSNMEYAKMLVAFALIIKMCYQRLLPHRFAVFVLGEYRNKHGNYPGFVADIIRLFLEAGFSYYNEAILVTSIGSLAIRVGNQFEGSRKFGKTHQNILTFLKGDAKLATKACQPPEQAA